MASVCIEPQFLPPIETFARLLDFDRIWFDTKAWYRKTTYRNRCYLAGPNGRLLLSVPVIGGRSGHRPFDSVRISYEEDWQRDHRESFSACYRSSPYFEFYEDGFMPFFERRFDYLVDLNQALFEWIANALAHPWQIKRTEFYHEDLPPGTADFREAIHPKPVRSRPDAFYSHPTYGQVFEAKTGFLPGLSIVDMLFNEGPGTAALLRKAAGHAPSSGNA